MVGRERTQRASGMALAQLLRRSPPNDLKRLIGKSVVETLESLDQRLLADDRLRTVASKLIDPTEAFRDPDKSASIVRLLPLPKARELADRFGIDDGKFLFDRLAETARASSSLQILHSFFGVAREMRAPTIEKAATTEVKASYGLFDYQRAAARKVAKALERRPNKVVLHMPTGAGKTRTAMHAIVQHICCHEPTVVCWLAQNEELLDQAAEEFEKAWNRLGNRSVALMRFWGKHSPEVSQIRDGMIISGLAKMNALEKREPMALPYLADRVSLTVIDEAHQAIAPSYASILQILSSKHRENQLLGLTATPGRSWSNIAEDVRLAEFFDNQKVVLKVEDFDDPISFLIKEGYLALTKFRTLNSEAGLSLSKQDLERLSAAIDVPHDLLNRLGEDAKRNLKITIGAEDLLARHNRIIVFAASVASARLLAAILSVRGHEAHVVTAESSGEERRYIVNRFRGTSADPIIVCNYGVLTTGFDAPATSAALIARPTRSLVLYSQMVGRATRGPKAGGNAEAEIVTVIDPHLPGFGSIAEAFRFWEDIWNEPR